MGRKKAPMEKVRKTYVNCPTASLYVERFRNYREFLDTLDARKGEEKKSWEQRTPLDSWNGVTSWDEAYKLLLDGWEKPVKNIEMNFDKSLMKVREKSRRKTFANIAGFAPIPAHAVMNLPNSMLDQRMEARKTKVLDFLIMIDRACKNSASEIEKRMSEQLAGIASLERDYGYRCRINVAFSAFSGGPRGNKVNTACILKVKDESQPFDIKRLAFPIVHAGMLRALMFRWERTLTAKDALDMPYDGYHEGAFGTSYEKWFLSRKEEFVKMVTDPKAKMIVLDFDSKVEDVIQKETGRR